MVIMIVSSRSENAMLSAVSRLRRMLRNAFLATKLVSVMGGEPSSVLGSPRVAGFPHVRGGKQELYRLGGGQCCRGEGIDSRSGCQSVKTSIRRGFSLYQRL